MSFRVQQYTLMKDVLAAQSKPKSPGQEYQHAPLVIFEIYFFLKNSVRTYGIV